MGRISRQTEGYEPHVAAPAPPLTWWEEGGEEAPQYCPEDGAHCGLTGRQHAEQCEVAQQAGGDPLSPAPGGTTGGHQGHVLYRLPEQLLAVVEAPEEGRAGEEIKGTAAGDGEGKGVLSPPISSLTQPPPPPSAPSPAVLQLPEQFQWGLIPPPPTAPPATTPTAPQRLITHPLSCNCLSSSNGG